MKSDIQSVISKLIEELNKTRYRGDLSDLGNEIGIVLGKFIDEDIFGFTKDDFVAGLDHGISIGNETHP